LEQGGYSLDFSIQFQFSWNLRSIHSIKVCLKHEPGNFQTQNPYLTYWNGTFECHDGSESVTSVRWKSESVKKN
jgi:hypothetical protein